MYRTILAGVLVIVMAVAIVVPFGAPAPPVANLTIDVAGGVRHYRVVQPRDRSAEGPIVLAFHGIGDTPESMASYSRLDRLADDLRATIVYPEAVRGMWRTDPDDNPDLELFDALRAEFGADRVVVIGMSHGARFAHLVAASRAGAVAGLVAHSGTRPGDLDVPEVPALLIVGDEDTAHDAVVRDFEQLRAAGTEAELMVVPQLGHAWSSAHAESIAAFVERHGG